MRVAYYMANGESDLAAAIRATAIASGFGFRACNGSGLIASDRDADVTLAVADAAVSDAVRALYGDTVVIVPAPNDPAKVVADLGKALAKLKPPIGLPYREKSAKGEASKVGKEA